MRTQHLLIGGLAALMVTGATVLRAPIHVMPHVQAAADTATIAQPRYAVVRDKSGTSSLAIVLPGTGMDTDAGNFDLAVDSSGVYEGNIAIVPSSANVDHLQGSVSATFYPSSSGTKSTVAVRFEGIINPMTLDATINVWINGTHTLLQTDNGSTRDAVKVAAKILSLFQAQDWTDLYPFLLSAQQTSYTEQQFAQAMAAEQGQNPTIVSAALSGSGMITTTVSGFPSYQQPYTQTVKASDGTLTTTTTTMYLILESGSWHLWRVDPTADQRAKLQALPFQP